MFVVEDVGTKNSGLAVDVVVADEASDLQLDLEAAWEKNLYRSAP